MNRLAAVISSTVVFLVIIVGLVVSGSPGQRRQLRFDQQRVSDLQRLSNQLEQYWQRNEVLPPTLSGLVDGTRVAAVPDDPESGSPYEYLIDGPRSFRLCATFALPSEEDPYQTFWNHSSGRTCFSFLAEPSAGTPRQLP